MASSPVASWRIGKCASCVERPAGGEEETRAPGRRAGRAASRERDQGFPFVAATASFTISASSKGLEKVRTAPIRFA